MRFQMNHAKALLLTVALSFVGAAQVGCSTNPATGASSLTLLSWEEERALGAEAAPAMTNEFGGAVANATTEAYVNEVGRKLAAGVEEGVPDLEWEFTLLDSDVINAFALPGGKVFLSRGLAEQLDSEAAMAGVLGHEIGHVTARHGNQRISTQIGFNVLLAAGAVAVGVADEDTAVRRYGQVGLPVLAVGGNLVLLKYGRDEELEADMLGVRYMARAGYDPIGQRRVMETLQAAAGGARPPEWLSTHPASETRIQRIDELLAGEYAYTQNSSEYQTFPQQYQQRMLNPLAGMAPAKHQATAIPDAETSVLAAATLWCAHCRAEHAEAP